MDESRIIELLNNRDETAIVEMSNMFCGLIKSICYNIGLNTEETSECFNDILYSVWKSVPPEKPKYLVSYISKIARRTAIDVLRNKTAEKRTAEIDTLYSELCECISDTKTVENEVDERELVTILNNWLNELDEFSRAIFIKRYFYAKSIDEISSELKLSKNNAAIKLYRLRKKLKLILNKEGIFYE